MEKTNGDLVKKIENNLRFVITISIFFLSLFPESKIQGAVLIVGYILDYLVFEIREKQFHTKNLKWINRATLVGIGSYIIPLGIIGLSSVDGGVFIPLWQAIFWKFSIFTSILAAVTIPAIILVMTLLLSGDKTLKERFCD